MSQQTVLIVDDDEVLGQVLSRVLGRQGCRVLLAASVDRALQLAADQVLALAMLDLCLPDGDGMELARKLRDSFPNLPLLLMTAYPLRLRDHPEMAGYFARVLTKPLNLLDL